MFKSIVSTRRTNIIYIDELFLSGANDRQGAGDYQHIGQNKHTGHCEQEGGSGDAGVRIMSHYVVLFRLCSVRTDYNSPDIIYALQHSRQIKGVGLSRDLLTILRIFD